MVNFAKPKVLVIHALRPTSRQTTIDHLLSFREHLPDADVQYLHFQQPLPRDIGQVSPDLLIVNYDYLNYRFSPLWPFIKKRHKDIARCAGKVVAIAQDDFWANKLLDNWCMDWNVDRILTPIDNNREVLYPRSIKTKEFRTGLTGYVKSGPIPTSKLLQDRPIDLGQRVREMPPHLGRLAQAKARQAVTIADAARTAGFAVDISTRVEESFIGTAWFEFLSSCKFTVGMKGGASLHDPFGLIHTKVQSYRARHPEASFDEIEQRCFKGKDMKYEFTAISPRLFESAMAGTCQILQLEDYLGVLEPWRDYIPLEGDFSNMGQVLEVMKDLDRCQQIVENAKVALIDSKVFDYSRLVEVATQDLVVTRFRNDKEWDQLSQILRVFRQAQDVDADLHDSALHMLKSGNRGSNTCSKAETTVIENLRRHSLESWLSDMQNMIEEDSIDAISPWIWRNV